MSLDRSKDEQTYANAPGKSASVPKSGRLDAASLFINILEYFNMFFVIFGVFYLIGFHLKAIHTRFCVLWSPVLLFLYT